MVSKEYTPSPLTGLTWRFATHAAELRYEDLPAEVIEKTKLILRDGIGNQIAASSIAEPAARMVDLVRELGGTSECTVVGHRFRSWSVASPRFVLRKQ